MDYFWENMLPDTTSYKFDSLQSHATHKPAARILNTTLFLKPDPLLVPQSIRIHPEINFFQILTSVLCQMMAAVTSASMLLEATNVNVQIQDYAYHQITKHVMVSLFHFSRTSCSKLFL